MKCKSVAFFFGDDSGYFKYHTIFLAEYCKPYLPIIFCGEIKSNLSLHYTKNKSDQSNIEKMMDSH